MKKDEQKTFPQLIMAAASRSTGMRLSVEQVRAISLKGSIRDAAHQDDMAETRQKATDSGIPPYETKVSRRKPGCCVTYTVRVDVTYDGLAEKPCEHVVRKWVLDNLIEGRSPPNLGRRPFKSKSKIVRGKRKKVGNVITLQVRCAGCH